MKIIFDSNVWQIVALPNELQNINEPSLTDFKKIRGAIIGGKIEAFLSETVFTIEAIKKEERQDFFSSTNIKVDIEKFKKENKTIFELTIGPADEDAINFKNRPILKKYFDEAIKLGFKIVRLPRIGGIVNEEVDAVRYDQQGAGISTFLEEAFEVSKRIEENGAGIVQLQKIGKHYDSSDWKKGLIKAPEADKRKIAKAAAEWADGDSVAISIALGCDYFCTRDKAKGAGNKSVLSETNLSWLKNDYGFETIVPEELAKLL